MPTSVKSVFVVAAATTGIFAVSVCAAEADAREALVNRELASIGLAITVTVDGGTGCVAPNTARDETEEQWREFFGYNAPYPRSKPNQASGTVLSADGEILSLSVTKYCSSYDVTLADGREVVAKPVGFDPVTEVALLRVEADGLTVAKIGDPKTVMPGDHVMAFGSPFKLKGTLSRGVVSTANRHLPDYSDNTPYIQSDAMINPGSAGGPLLNEYGEVVGAHALLLSRRNAFDGMSFALPIDVAMRVVEDLREFGEVRRGWLGVLIEDPENGIGVVITEVESDGPAAGIVLAGDLISAFDDNPVSSSNELRHVVQMYRPGDTVTITVSRGEESMDLTVTLAQRPEE